MVHLARKAGEVNKVPVARLVQWDRLASEANQGLQDLKDLLVLRASVANQDNRANKV